MDQHVFVETRDRYCTIVCHLVVPDVLMPQPAHPLEYGVFTSSCRVYRAKTPEPSKHVPEHYSPTVTRSFLKPIKVQPMPKFRQLSIQPSRSRPCRPSIIPLISSSSATATPRCLDFFLFHMSTSHSCGEASMAIGPGHNGSF